MWQMWTSNAPNAWSRAALSPSFANPLTHLVIRSRTKPVVGVVRSAVLSLVGPELVANRRRCKLTEGSAPQFPYHSLLDDSRTVVKLTVNMSEVNEDCDVFQRDTNSWNVNIFSYSKAANGLQIYCLSKLLESPSSNRLVSRQIFN